MSTTTALHTPCRTAYIRLLNCTKKKLATESIIQQATADPQCLALLLQEPWNKADRGLPPNTPGFDLFSPTPLRPKYITYVRRGTSATQRFTDGDSFLEMIITIGGMSFSLLNVYSPGHPKHIAQLITTRFRTPPDSCILLGDLNAHHLWWSAERDLDSTARRKVSLKSNILAEWLKNRHFTLHNEPGALTYFPDRLTQQNASPAVTDLALSRGGITDRITAWAMEEAHPSDQRTIKLYLSLDDLEATEPEPEHFRSWRKADWSLFDNHLRNLELDNPLEAAGTITAILQAISAAIDAAVPLKIRHTKPRGPWWHPELERMSIRIQRAKRRIRSTPNASADARARFNSLNAQWRCKEC
jgi:hypothetical protein